MGVGGYNAGSGSARGQRPLPAREGRGTRNRLRFRSDEMTMSMTALSGRVGNAVDSLTAAALSANSAEIRAALAALADDLSTIAKHPDLDAAGAVRRRAKGVALDAAKARETEAVDAIAELVVAVAEITDSAIYGLVGRGLGADLPMSGPADPESGPLVLVIDDDDDTRALIAWRLRSAGYRVLTAEDGSTGIGMVRRERPALVISDLNMPLAPGELVILALRMSPETAGIPILVISGDLSRLGPEHPVDGAISKPFDGQVLLEEVRRLTPVLSTAD
jgi:CheY-like chemotaxis protein